MADRTYSDHDPRHLMDLHEADAYQGSGLGVWEDPDGGLLRYSAVIRRVLELADRWMAEGLPGAHELTRAVRGTLVNPDVLPLLKIPAEVKDRMPECRSKCYRSQDRT